MADERFKIHRSNDNDLRRQIGGALNELDDDINSIVDYLGAVPPGGIVLDYLWSTLLTGDPTAGHIAADNAVHANVTLVRMSITSSNGNDVSVIIEALRPGDIIGIFQQPAPQNTSYFSLDAQPILDVGGQFYIVAVTPSSGAGQALPVAQDDPCKFYVIANPNRQLPPGGATDMIIVKQSTDDYDVEWEYGTTRLYAPKSHSDIISGNPHGVSWDTLLGKPTEFNPTAHPLYSTYHSDVDSTGTLEPRQGLFWSGSLFQIEFRVNWRGVWGPQEYQQNEMVYDSGYTMISNKVTTDRAAPQPLGDPAYTLPDVPVWSDYLNDSVVYSGHFYTFNETGYFRALRVWVPEVTGTTNYRFVIVRNPSTNPSYTVIEEPVLTAGDWTVLAVDLQLVLAGEELIIYIDALNSGGEQTWAYNWLYGGQQQIPVPTAGNYQTNNQENVLSINWLDAETIPVDHRLELQVVPGTIFEISEIGNPVNFRHYQVQGAYSEGAGYTDYNVVIVDTGGIWPPPVTSPTQIRAVQPITDPTKFVGIPTYWSGNQPVWGTIVSFLQFDGVDTGADPDNAYGVDIAFQRLSISEDWDLVALSGGGGSGGGSGGEPFPEVPDDGNTYGRIFGTWETVFTQNEILNEGALDTVYFRKDAKNSPITDNVEIRREGTTELVMHAEGATGQRPSLKFRSDSGMDWEMYTVQGFEQTWSWRDNSNSTTFTLDSANYGHTGKFCQIMTKQWGDTLYVGPEVANDTQAYGRVFGGWDPVYRKTEAAPIVHTHDPFAGPTTTGFVPDPVTGGNRFLKADGSWEEVQSIPAGGVSTKYDFDATVGGLPAAGNITVNNADQTLATQIRIHILNKESNDISPWLENMKTTDVIGLNAVGGSGETVYYTLDSDSVNQGNYFDMAVTYYSGPGGILNGQEVDLILINNPASKVPAGGTTGQRLTKASNANYDTFWEDVAQVGYSIITAGHLAEPGIPLAADSEGGAFSITLPATPADDDTIPIIDPTGFWATNNVTVDRNGNLIDGKAENMELDLNWGSLVLVFRAGDWLINPDAIGTQGEQGQQGDQGLQGPKGDPGDDGDPGDPGVGVPPGGSAGQALVKIDAVDFNTEWGEVAGYWSPNGGDIYNNNSGNVGINITLPEYKLDVGGKIRSNLEIICTGNDAFRSAALGNDQVGFFIRNDGASTYFMLTDPGDPYGTWNALRPFHVNNITGNVWICTTLYADQANSRVGIGTTGPEQPLHVVGDQRFDGEMNVYRKIGGGEGGQINIYDSTDSPGWSIDSGPGEEFRIFKALGALGQSFSIDATDGGITAGNPGGGSQGIGTINATGLFVNGVAVGGGSGGFDFNANANYPVNEYDYYGETEKYKAGGSITKGDMVGINVDTARLEVLRADSVLNPNSGTYRPPLGIALNGGGLGTSINVFKRGLIKLVTGHTVLSGSTIYLGRAGKVVSAKPAAGDGVWVVGYAPHDDIVFMNITNRWEVA